MAVEAELKRRNQSGQLIPWALNDDGTDPVQDGGVHIRLEALLELLQPALQVVSPEVDRRFEWQLAGEENKPLYIGSAAPGTETSDPTWKIERYTFVAGPSGAQVPSLIETRTGAWDERTTLF